MKQSHLFKSTSMKNKLFTIPNLISLFRLVLTWPIVYAICHDQLFYVFILGILAILSDFFDGYFSRVLNQHSDSGKILDPIVDCIIVVTIMITLHLRQQIPSWYIKLMIIRYGIIACILAIYRIRSKITPQSILSGKISIGFIAATIAFALIQPQLPQTFLIVLYASTCLMILSLIDYLYTYAF